MGIRSSLAAAVAVACLLCLTGCSGGDVSDRQAVSGTVSLNGSPLEKGTVSFQPMEKGVGGGGTITGGKYAIARNDGPTTGKHRVVISSAGGSSAESANAAPGEPPPPPKELVPEDWNVKSDHTVEIKSGKNEQNFDITAKK
jgi:hypothetical protein